MDRADPDGWAAPPRKPDDRNAAPVLSAEGFEGPLDWLVEMARARKVDLRRVPILALLDAFGAAMEGALATGPSNGVTRPGSEVARWGDWLVMAADLVLLRSRLLVPLGAAEAREAERDAETLRRQLVGRAEMAAAADWLDRRMQLGRDVFGRGMAAGTAGVRGGRTGDIVGLLRACLVALSLPADAASIYRVPPPPFWSVAQATARIRIRLPELGDAGAGLEAFFPAVATNASDRDARCRRAVASTLIAALELAREGEIALQQVHEAIAVCRAPKLPT